MRFIFMNDLFNKLAVFYQSDENTSRKSRTKRTYYKHIQTFFFLIQQAVKQSFITHNNVFYEIVAMCIF